ncbi:MULTISPECIES: hypothetical protein [unclassified Bradyrhizobium]|uniref:hypothetical protein n=1 Tax=Bradyrhizobium sp. USDA 4541 TaxID=2817704 RepID=UPI0020A5D423|nr:hypothetical protein [Bradyrhizobium sp. USDA 4541]MCP1854620.1 hypothetical protein [Bradyrhizobium sp. USDA 4541]
MTGDQCLPVYRYRTGDLPRIASAGDTVQKILYVGNSSAISNKVESLGSALMHLWAETACGNDCAKPHERNEIAGESG